MTTFERDPLYQKAKVYMARALDEDRDDPHFGLLCALSLEALTRAALAHVHPALLADPKVDEGKSLLHAFGFPTERPISIPMKAVVARCQIVVDGFDKSDADWTTTIIDHRNTELHSGDLGFANFPTALWLRRFYRICSLLLASIGENLEAFLGPTEASRARIMIDEVEAAIVATARAAVGRARAAFEALPEGERENRARREPAFVLFQHDEASTWAECPACSSQTRLIGTVHGEPDRRLDGDTLIVRRTAVPSVLVCHVCDLSLSGYQVLDAAGLGGQFTTEDHWDAGEYYAELVADGRYVEDYAEYMNE